MKIPHKFIQRPSFEHGMNDSEFADKLATTQVSLSENYDMTPEGRLDSVGGSIRKAASSTGSSETIHAIYEYRSVAAGVITRSFMVFCGTRLVKYNSSDGSWTEIDTDLAGVKPGVALFRDNSGVDVMYYCDGTVFKFYDGLAVTNVLTNFQTGGAGATVPRFLLTKHQRLWAAGGSCEHIRVFYSPQVHAEQNWGANDYITIEGGNERVTGLGLVYDYPFITTEDSNYIVTGRAGDANDPFVMIQVARNRGCTSHWSIVTEGGYVYWLKEKRIYIGKLRAAEQDGMETEIISHNVQRTLDTIDDGTWDSVEGVFFSEKQQIYWALEVDDASAPNILLVYSIARSHPELPAVIGRGPDLRYVWAGKMTGLSYTALGVIKDSDGLPILYTGGTDGHIRQLYSGYLEDRTSVGAGGSKKSYEIDTREETFGGPTGAARIYAIYPIFYQKMNGSMQIEWIINQSRRLPSDPKTITFGGNIPYLHTDDDEVVSEVGSTIFKEKSTLTAKIRVGQKCTSILYIMTNVGSDDNEEFSMVGFSQEIQQKRVAARD